MITLNVDKQLVIIKSWEDISTRPGFTSNLDPTTVKLKAVIGSYELPEMKPCGLSNCHQGHFSGFLVVAENGVETNIGNKCGRREFGIDFQHSANLHKKDVTAYLQRQTLGALKNRIPNIKAEVLQLREQELGADWVNRGVTRLSGQSTGLPRDIVSKANECARNGTGAIIRTRRMTKDERDRTDVMERGSRDEQKFIDEQLGQLEGFTALQPSNSLHRINKDITEVVKAIEIADIDSLSHKELGALSKLSQDLDANLDKYRNAVNAGRRLLTRSNISQLGYLATTSAEQKLFKDFLNTLPEA